jgi:hypothetical protein
MLSLLSGVISVSSIGKRSNRCSLDWKDTLGRGMDIYWLHTLTISSCLGEWAIIKNTLMSYGSIKYLKVSLL